MAKKIVNRIDGILKNINSVQREMNGITIEEFKTQHLLSNAISFDLAQIGERMNKIEEYLIDKYPKLPWKQARKMRNIIVHDYDNVDLDTIYITAIKDLPILKNELINVKSDITKASEKTFNTKRLVLRRWNDFDADELFDLAKEPEIGYWCGWKPHEHVRDSFFALHNFLEIDESYAICLKDIGTIVGTISLSFHSDLANNDDECELGYWIGKPYWNNGYATEAIEWIIEHAFNDLKLSRIWCGYYDGNIKSKHIQEKFGFEYQSTCDTVEVPQLKTTRVGHSNVLTKEKWDQFSH